MITLFLAIMLLLALIRAHRLDVENTRLRDDVAAYKRTAEYYEYKYDNEVLR